MKKSILILLTLNAFLSSYGQSTMRPNIYFQDMNYYNIADIPLRDTEKFSFSLYTKHKFVENENYIWNKLQLPSQESGKSLKSRADIDFGAFYRFKNFSLSLATKNILGTALKLDGEQLLMNQREYYVNTSYLFNIKNDFEIEPSLLYRKELMSELDMGLRLGFFKRVDMAYQLRLIQLRQIFILHGNITKSLSVGAAYDYSMLISDNNIDAVIRYGF